MNKRFKASLLTLCSSFLLVKPIMLKAADDINKQPSMAFFEYLADQIEADGKLIGPMDMQKNKVKLQSNSSQSNSSQSNSKQGNSKQGTTKSDINKRPTKTVKNERGSQ